MEHTLISIRSLAAAASLIFGSYPGGVDAAVLFSGLKITDNSFSVALNGTLPSSLPSTYTNLLIAVNPQQFEDPGFTIGPNLANATSTLFSGGQAIAGGRLGNPIFGDFIAFAFSSNFTANEVINGTITASWSSLVFDPTAIGSLVFYWGFGGTASSPSDTVGGTFLGTAAVPEISSALILGLGILGGMAQRRRSG